MKNSSFCGLVLPLLLISCGGSPTEEPMDPARMDPVPMADPEPMTEPEPVKPEPDPILPIGDDPVVLDGAWVSRLVNSQCFDGTVGEDTVNITTVSLLRVETEADGQTLRVETQVCDIQLSPYRENITSYPSAAISALNIPAQEVHLEKMNGGAAYVPPRRIALLGWLPDGDPMTDAVPEEADDQRVVDADQDGHPGVTLEVDASIDGEIFIANRNIIDIHAVVISSDEIRGRSSTTQVQKILDASPRLLRFSNIEASTNPDVASSSYTMVRIEGTDCASAMARASLLPEPQITACPF